MNFVQSCIRYPLTVGVAVIFVVLFGLISLFQLPTELIPKVSRLTISIETVWPGASPYEIEREIINRQEEMLRGIPGLTQIRSTSRSGVGNIILEFRAGTNKDGALLRASNRLEQVRSYPVGVDKPVLVAGRSVEDGMAYFAITYRDLERAETEDIAVEFDFAKDNIKTEYERIDGIESVGLFGGTPHEMQVHVDLAQLALRNITLSEVGDALERENRNFSGGSYDEGKLRYVVRTVGEYKNEQDIENIIIAVRNDVPIYLRDVGQVRLGFEKPAFSLFNIDQKVLYLVLFKSNDANALEVIEASFETMDRLNNGVLADRGLVIQEDWTQKRYIEGAIDLVTNSLLIGAFLSVTVLLVFLRNYSSTIIIVTAIPVCALGTLIVMGWLDRSINVISLAGLAFAIGMVVDNSIVVFDNIYRHRQLGKSNKEAAQRGTSEVWGAVLSSTLTTVAVFVPVAFMEEEIGQLFTDISIALCSAVLISLVVAMSVIPSLSARILSDRGDLSEVKVLQKFWAFTDKIGGLKQWMLSSVKWVNETLSRQVTVVASCVLGAVLLSFVLLPDAEYLPGGDTDYLEGYLQLPPGYNLDEIEALHPLFKEKVAPLAAPETGSAEADALPGGGIQDFFLSTSGAGVAIGASSGSSTRVKELIPVFQEVTSQIPGVIDFYQQWSMFGGMGSSGRSIDLEIRGPDLGYLMQLGKEIMPTVYEAMPGAQAFPVPGLDNGEPEVQVVIDRRRAADVGISNRDLGFAVSALVDGALASKYIHLGKEIDLKVIAKKDDVSLGNGIEQVPIVTASGQLVTLGGIAEVSRVKGAAQIEHRERERTVTLQIAPPEGVLIEAAMNIIQEQVIDPVRESGRLGDAYRLSMTGSASKLVEAGRALQWNFLLALTITYLLLCVLFQSFYYPFVILFSVPFAAFGGVLGLFLASLAWGSQGLDVLTMLGFIILIGTVVNNAILIVHRTLQQIREHGMAPNEAVLDAIEKRIRPIFMSVGTSSLAMLPLVLFPGAGSELYRGLGSVVVAGLLVSTFFTLFLVPTVLSLLLEGKQRIGVFKQVPA